MGISDKKYVPTLIFPDSPSISGSLSSLKKIKKKIPLSIKIKGTTILKAFIFIYKKAAC